MEGLSSIILRRSLPQELKDELAELYRRGYTEHHRDMASRISHPYLHSNSQRNYHTVRPPFSSLVLFSAHNLLDYL